MYSFLNFEQVSCFMSSFNCCFLTHIPAQFKNISFQETNKMVWYSHLLKNFPEFVVIHTVEKNCLPLLKNHTHTHTHTHTPKKRHSNPKKQKTRTVALCLPVLRSFWKGRGFHSILFCTLFQLCTEGKEVLLKNPTLPRRQPVGFSNEGVRDGELRGHILLSHNTNITSFLLSRLKEEMRGGEPLAVSNRKHP